MGRKYLGTKQVNVMMLPIPKLIKEVREYARTRGNELTYIPEASEKKYKVLVWFRFVSAGEVEKDFEIHYTYAISQEDAKRKVTIEHYSGHSEIPFRFDVSEIKTY